MNRTTELVIGILGTIIFLGAGLAILYWGAGQIWIAQQSLTWPATSGTVISSEQTSNDPTIIYQYLVEGQHYMGERISVAPFSNPGGKGNPIDILRRYPEGKTVSVYYRPDQPEVAVLEPGDFSRILFPMFFGLLFVLGSGLVFRDVMRTLRGEQPVPLYSPTERRRKVKLGTIIFAVTIYTVMVLLTIELQEPGQATRTILWQTLLYLPLPWVIWHYMSILIQFQEDGMGLTRARLILMVFEAGEKYSYLRSSQLIVCGGGIYMALIFCPAMFWLI